MFIYNLSAFGTEDRDYYVTHEKQYTDTEFKELIESVIDKHIAGWIEILRQQTKSHFDEWLARINAQKPNTQHKFERTLIARRMTERTSVRFGDILHWLIDILVSEYGFSYMVPTSTLETDYYRELGSYMIK